MRRKNQNNKILEDQFATPRKVAGFGAKAFDTLPTPQHSTEMLNNPTIFFS